MIPPLLPWQVEAWSLTSFGTTDWTSRPQVHAWLRGAAGDGPPETYLAWRDDVAFLTSGKLPNSELRTVFEHYPVLARERLREPTSSLAKKLAELAKENANTRIVIVAPDGAARKISLVEAIKDEDALRYATLVLPSGLACLDCGMLRADATIDSHWSNRIVPGGQRRMSFEGKTADVLWIG